MKKYYLILLAVLASFDVHAIGRYTVADIVDKINPAVVHIKSIQHKKEDGKSLNPFSKKDKKAALQNLNEGARKINNNQNFNVGSGAIISSDGLVITNYHVVEVADELSITTSNNKFYTANVVGFDVKSDLALIKIENPNNEKFTVVKFADSDKARIGEMVIAVGNPYGLSGTVSTGIISGRNRNIGSNIYDDFLQTDASINPGNSGGPLFNLDGDIVGINTAIFSQGGGSDGIGFSIPSNTASLIAQQLKETGKVVRGWLGIQAEIVNEDVARALKLDTKNGVLVADVTKNSPAGLAGIKNGDVILKYNDINIKKLFDLPKMVAKTPLNTEVKITVLRNGKQKELTAKIVSEDEASRLDLESQGGVEVMHKKVLGFFVTELTPELKKEMNIKVDKGIYITKVESTYKKYNLLPGDIILQVDQKNVETVAGLEKIIKESDKKTMLLFINRKGSNIFSVIEK